jgi:hypothetical protein
MTNTEEVYACNACYASTEMGFDLVRRYPIYSHYNYHRLPFHLSYLLLRLFRLSVLSLMLAVTPLVLIVLHMHRQIWPRSSCPSPWLVAHLSASQIPYSLQRMRQILSTARPTVSSMFKMAGSRLSIRHSEYVIYNDNIDQLSSPSDIGTIS